MVIAIVIVIVRLTHEFCHFLGFPFSIITLQDCGHLSIVHSAFQVSAGIAKYGIHLGQHQFNRCFAQNGSIRELAKEETSGFNTPRRDRLAHSSCLLVDVIPGQVCTDSLQRLQ